MKNNLIHGVHIFESDLANELDSIVEDAYHYGATEAEIRSLIAVSYTHLTLPTKA